MVNDVTLLLNYCLFDVWKRLIEETADLWYHIARYIFHNNHLERQQKLCQFRRIFHENNPRQKIEFPSRLVDGLRELILYCSSRNRKHHERKDGLSLIRCFSRWSFMQTERKSSIEQSSKTWRNENRVSRPYVNTIHILCEEGDCWVENLNESLPHISLTASSLTLTSVFVVDFIYITRSSLVSSRRPSSSFACRYRKKEIESKSKKSVSFLNR